MIQAESDPQRRDEYLQKLMELPNQVGYCSIVLAAGWSFARAGFVCCVGSEGIDECWSSEVLCC